MGETTDPNTAETYRVGDPIFIEGTGRYWRGSTFRAVVADVRPSDNTVKVRYSDGGYKRFDREELTPLVRTSSDVGHEGSLALSPVDSFDETMFARPGSSREIARDFEESRLKRLIQEGTATGDTSKAEAKQALTALHRRWEALELEHAALAEVVRRRDFLAAHEIQQRIDLLDVGALAHEGKSFSSILKESLYRGLGGGLTGAAAMSVQVTTLMWLRTTLYYQYRYGTSTLETVRTLYSQGGPLRFYRGFFIAMFQAPMSRFGDTASNVGVMTFLDSRDSTRDLPIATKTIASASVASAWRITLMPLDTCKTMLQVEGADGLKKLKLKYRAHGAPVLFHGALALSGSSFIGHYFWYGVYNAADAQLPVPTDLLPRLARNAVVGFAASAVSDTATNAIRVLKTYRQANERHISYPDAFREITATEGILGLWGRGLGTRILANGVQAAMFSAAWKYLQQKYTVV